MLAVLCGTALRVGELVALDRSNIEFLARTLSVTKHSAADGTHPETKTGADHCRAIALPQRIQGVLEGLRAPAVLGYMHLHDLRRVALTGYARQPYVTFATPKAFRGGTPRTP